MAIDVVKKVGKFIGICDNAQSVVPAKTGIQTKKDEKERGSM